ncbi:MAG: phosphatidate cytidylyltransferase [Treponema sp.]
MNKIIKRLFIFFLGIPLVLGIATFNFYNHLPLNIVMIACSFLAAVELYMILKHNTPLLPLPLVAALSTALPVGAYIFTLARLSLNYTNWMFLIAALIIMGYEAAFSKTFVQSNTKIAASVLIVFYSGFLFTFMTRITEFQHSGIFLCVFFFLVFICDSLAWFFGMLFGKNNRGFVACSPNKSIAGFIGGYAGAAGAGALSHILFKDIFTGSIVKGIALGLAVATAGIAGDLIESVFKRSAGVKDSGTIIPGRGGVLDSIDSLLTAAPVYYILAYALYSPIA